MNKFKLAGICVIVSTFALSGCVARTYNLTRDRVDQDLTSTSGNRGYIMGKAPEPKERKTTRDTRVFEVEFGKPEKTTCPAITPLVSESVREPSMVEIDVIETPVQDVADFSSEKYTVQKNDTLQKISKKFYGTTKRWMKLYEANKDTLSGPDKLYAGQVLNIPAGPKVSAPSQQAQYSDENLK